MPGVAPVLMVHFLPIEEHVIMLYKLSVTFREDIIHNNNHREASDWTEPFATFLFFSCEDCDVN